MATEEDMHNDRIPAEGPNSGNEAPPITERDAYFQALRLWIQQAQMYQNLSTCFPYYLMSFQGLQHNTTNGHLLNNNYQFQGHPFPFRIPNIDVNGPDAVQPGRFDLSESTAANIIARYGGYEYVVPSFLKRLVAEFIDFILLVILKLLLAIIAVDVLEIVDLDKFDFYKLSENYDDYKFAMELTSELLFLELIYRLLVCIFEAVCLYGHGGRSAGATPGKALLGLKVVTATAIIPVPGRNRETVIIYPGRPLNFVTSLARSLIKNLLISLLFPICMLIFVFKHNRTGYDIICGVIVVEENLFPRRVYAA